jgi:hypothetical protein
VLQLMMVAIDIKIAQQQVQALVLQLMMVAIDIKIAQQQVQALVLQQVVQQQLVQALVQQVVQQLVQAAVLRVEVTCDKNIIIIPRRLAVSNIQKCLTCCKKVINLIFYERYTVDVIAYHHNVTKQQAIIMS